MLSLLLFRFWPVLVPLIVYWLWLKHVGRKATIAGQPVLKFRDGPWYWAVLASLLTAAACFVLLGVQATAGGKGEYVPPHMQNGELVPGHVEPKK